jgi:hypothetical protein
VLCCFRPVSHKLARALFIKPIGLQRPIEPGLLPHVDRHRWLQHRKKIVEPNHVSDTTDDEKVLVGAACGLDLIAHVLLAKLIPCLLLPRSIVRAFIIPRRYSLCCSLRRWHVDVVVSQSLLLGYVTCRRELALARLFPDVSAAVSSKDFRDLRAKALPLRQRFRSLLHSSPETRRKRWKLKAVVAPQYHDHDKQDLHVPK